MFNYLENLGWIRSPSHLSYDFVWINQAYEKCFQNLHYVERHEEHTIAHAVQTNYKKTKVLNLLLHCTGF